MNRCFWCGAPDVQHVDPCETSCLGGDDEGAAFDTALERVAQEIAEEHRLSAEKGRDD